MASSNRHWPSMFKSKPCSSHQQWQQEMNLSSNILPNSSGSHEERSPEVKSRWNPRPEQIQILEGIFNSGMVNPPRDEIRKIRTQLQEYGKVGDANVFYWFQNRKSRTKHKQRLLQNNNNKSRIHHHHQQLPIHSSTTASSSEKSSSNNSSEMFGFSPICPSNSPTTSISTLPFALPLQGEFTTPRNVVKNDSVVFADDESNSSIRNNRSGFYDSSNKSGDENMKLQNLNFTATTSVPSILKTPLCPTMVADLSTVNGYQGNDVSDQRGTIMIERRSTVFINDVAIEVTTAPFNVREAFGDDAVLLHPSGHPVLTDHLGVTLHPLQHAAFYYLINTFAPS